MTSASGNCLLVLPAALLSVCLLAVLIVFGLLWFGRDLTASQRKMRAIGLIVVGALAALGFPLLVVALELWTDRFLSRVTWNPLNNLSAAVVALFGLLGVGLGVKRVPTSKCKNPQLPFPVSKRVNPVEVEESKGLRGGVLTYAAQVCPQLDAADRPDWPF